MEYEIVDLKGKTQLTWAKFPDITFSALECHVREPSTRTYTIFAYNFRSLAEDH